MGSCFCIKYEKKDNNFFLKLTQYTIVVVILSSHLRHALVMALVDDVTRQAEVAHFAGESVVEEDVTCSQVAMQELKHSI